MTDLRQALTAAGAALALLWSAPADAQTSLSGAEIRKLVSGRSASWTRPDGYSGTITYGADGTLTSRLTVMGAPISISGTWQVRGDRFCRTIRQDPVPTRCQSVVPVSGQAFRFVNEDGSATTTTFR